MSHSDQINEIARALAKAQIEMTSAAKDSSNPFFKSKYADLNSVLMACRPFLGKHGIAVTQIPDYTDKGMCLITMLIHEETGQYIKSTLPLNVKSDGKINELQALGSAISYLRRYTIQSMCGIATDEDDDGNSAKGYQSKPEVISPPANSISPKIITKEQADDLRNVISKCSPNFKSQVDDMLKERKINGFNNIGEQLFKNLMSRSLVDMQQFQASLAVEEPIAI